LIILVGFIGAVGIGALFTEVFRDGLLALFLPLYSRRKREKVLDRPTRERIYGYIIGNPGAYFGLIKEELDLGSGQLVYHIKQLEEAHLIYSKEDGAKKRFYPADIPKQKSTIPLLSEIQEKILGIIKDNEGIGQKKIASHLGISRQVAGYHLTKMERKGVIEKETVGREAKYYPSEIFSA
jgi:predicted transcriptional regulator